MLAEGETLAQHAVISSQRALEMAGVEAGDVDLILLATSSPDDIFGSACEVSSPCHARPCHVSRYSWLKLRHKYRQAAGHVGMKSRICVVLQVQKALGAKKAMAFDITAACSGFVVALVTAAQFIRTGQYSNVLVIGGDALSRFVDWRDRCKPTQQSIGDASKLRIIVGQHWSRSML